MKNILILLAGLAVYAGYGLWGLAYLLAVTVLSYGVGLWIPKRRWLLWVSVGLNAAVLLLLVKLQPLTALSFTAPLGISYFTLQIIAYHADIYRGKLQPERNFLRYCLYVTYLPKIFLGPIEPYNGALFANSRLCWGGLSLGGIRILWGLLKKLVIATRAGVVVGTISAAPDTYRGAYALAAMVLYSVQLYADFSGGMDIVLGASQILGVPLRENFDAPYFSQSVQEFWRRWHMTLGSWLREYVYIPLGGNRKGKLRKLLNTLMTFLVSGLWHGVHYLLWGLCNGIFVALGDKLKTKWAPVNRVLTFLLISLLWAFFVWPDTRTALSMLCSVATTFNYGALSADLLSLGLNLGEWIVLASGVGTLWAYDAFRGKLKPQKLAPAGRVAVLCALALVILTFGMYGIGFDVQAFIYGGF